MNTRARVRIGVGIGIGVLLIGAAMVQGSYSLHAHGEATSVAPRSSWMLAPGKSGFETVSFTRVQTPMPVSGVARNLMVRTLSTQPSDGAMTVIVFKGTAWTAIQLTIPAGSPAGLYIESLHTGSFNAGEPMWWRVSNSSFSPSAQTGAISLEYDPL